MKRPELRSHTFGGTGESRDLRIEMGDAKMHFSKLFGRKAILVLLVSLGVCATAMGVLRQRIQSDLDNWCVTAQAAHPHPDDDVAALLDYVQSDVHSLRQRNSAVWALGQARHPRALPILEGYFTGEPCDHARRLCQRELSKAVALCKGETPNLLHIRTP